MAQLKDLIVTGDSRVIGNNYTNNPKIAFGTCDTAAGTAVKVVTISDPAWNLQVGDIVGVKFTNSNTAGTVKLNVNGSGEKQLAYNTSRPFTGSDNWITGYANRTIFYQYDGTYWYWVTAGYNQNGDTYTTAKSWTGGGTAAKTATCHDYAAQANSWIMVQMVYANTSASALTLNINNQGAKPIYINGSASSASNYTLPKAHYLVFYNGTNYYFRTDGKIQGSITGDAATVNGKTVGVNVPADAKFTDNNTTYTFANGTNGFTVTPSGGSAQTVTVTPSISNNVTGSGTSGYLAKFNGANTITSGPQLGSGTTKFLREDGTWQTVSSGTTYTFAGGTNGFTVTPSGGSAQTVSVTPSISNNVTGSGTSGYLTKFNGGNTITNGPQLGSSTTTYLRNNGTWGDPEHVYVGSSAPSSSQYDVWIDTTGALNNTAIVNLIYPIGSIYISVNDTNPGILFGVGTWQRIAQGRTLVGIDENDSDFSISEKTGGEKEHTLTIDEMPSHSHGYRLEAGSLSGQSGNAKWSNTTYQNWSTEYTGGDEAHNNLQPYISVYMWKRTA